ncbi:MAG: cation:proton antiporter, partial [Chloroflexi bacterium]|nr:cation:proton antiporter [Chloroflexota bacterium]
MPTQDFSLLKDFATIMAVAGGALVLFRRFGQPAILGYLVAGVLIGPYSFSHPAVDDPDLIRRLADLGLVLMLFSIGLEFGLDRIRRLGFAILGIAAVEITVMVALGYELGRAMGWNGMNAIFLGAAMAISSSAILAKVLRDSGQLHGRRGQVIIGILVVEDFAAVLLLTVLSGVATTGTLDVAHVGTLAGKLALFVGSAVIVSGFFAPRIIDVVDKQGSRETLLITALTFCFGLALVAERLDLSAAAGAFLIGAVLGDTKHAKNLEEMTAPLRDVFAAIFFVSIGMLVDFSLIDNYLWEAMVVSAVFIIGKIAANSIGAYLSGEDTETSLGIGMGMPQVGEFSLAIVKTGADAGAVGPFLYPVVTLMTAITSFTYPHIARSPERAYAYVSRVAPRWLRGWAFNLRAASNAFRTMMATTPKRRAALVGALRVVALNLMLIMALLAIGPFILRSTDTLTKHIPLRANVLGLAIG